MATAFTPNSDGLNDILLAKSQCNGYEYALHIYNRYGQEIFHSFNINQSWNGTISGKQAPVGTYFYRLSFKTASGKSYDKKGDVTLIR